MDLLFGNICFFLLTYIFELLVQGRTLERVIIALSRRGIHILEMSFASLYVALTRVSSADHIRLFIHGTDYLTTAYLSSLHPDSSINSFLAGHSAIGGSLSKTWDEERALRHYDSTSTSS